MKIVQTRRISQVFFFAMFIWFCIVSTVGDNFWQLRAWPVNWFLQLDPLVAIGTMLTTHTLYAALLWALLTVVLTIVFGRFFCGWVCPFGSLHHFVGFLAHHNKSPAQKVRLNRYRKAQALKYLILVLFLGMAAFPSMAATLQTGLLDPIPLLNRSVNLVIVSVLDAPANLISASPRFYEGAWLMGLIFAAAVLLNLAIPRFYCRFLCPLGAFFGLVSRFALWRIGKTKKQCSQCKLCEYACEGGCEPSTNIRLSECLLCFNCREDCKDQLIRYQTTPSPPQEVTAPDISRRGFVLSFFGGVLAVPVVRLGNKLGANWYYRTVRPPGALEETEFLKRCIKCGQCMRVCPTNVIQPAGIQTGLESLWTPVLNNRIGSSGCQLNCVACGQICPTAAIRPITLAEKLGTGEFKDIGPIKLGTAFVDRNRCLPWAMNKPCIVCQENCPVSPKAIYTRDYFETVRDGILTVQKILGDTIETVEQTLMPERFAGGDYYCLVQGAPPVKILANTENSIQVLPDETFQKTAPQARKIEIQVRLQRPYVDIRRCIGCGICEHECPVSGRKAIRVSAEGETRGTARKMLLKI